MKRKATAAIVTLLALAIAAPIVYVGGEGAFYLATGERYFPEGTGYRRIYAPLDALSDRWPALYDLRQSGAEAWMSLSGPNPETVRVRLNEWPYYGRYRFDVF